MLVSPGLCMTLAGSGELKKRIGSSWWKNKHRPFVHTFRCCLVITEYFSGCVISVISIHNTAGPVLKSVFAKLLTFCLNSRYGVPRKRLAITIPLTYKEASSEQSLYKPANPNSTLVEVTNKIFRIRFPMSYVLQYARRGLSESLNVFMHFFYNKHRNII